MNKKSVLIPSGTAEAFRPNRTVWLLVVMLALLNMYLNISFPKAIRFAVLAAPFAVLFLFLIKDLRELVLFLPAVISMGFDAVDYGPFYIAPATVAVLLAFFAFAVYRISSFDGGFSYPVPLKIVGVAYIAQLLSVFASLYLHDSLVWNVLRDGHKYYIGALLLPVVYYWFGSGTWLERFLKVLTVSMICMCLYGIYQYTSGSLDSLGELASGFDLAGRVYSTIAGGPNSYSGVLELLVPSMLGIFFYFKNRFWKVLALAAVILGIFNVLYTFSRGGFITVTVTAMLYLIYRFRKKIWIPVVSFLCFAGYVSMNATEFERQLTVFSNPRELMLDTSMLHRYTSYSGFINEIVANPVEGVGWGSREYYHGRTSLYGFWEVRHQDSIDKIDRFGGLNSLLLEAPLKGGVFSMLSMLLTASAVIMSIWKLLKNGRNTTLGFGFACGLIGFGAHQLFDNLIPWPQTGAFFWMVVALLTAMAYPHCAEERDIL